MKKLISILVCLLLVVSSIAVSAATLPETSAWDPRCRNFNGDHSANGWNPSFKEDGGIGMYVTDGNLDGGFDKFENYMSLSRTSETGGLYWRDYITGYTWAPYFVQLKLYKSEGAEAYIYNYGAGGDGFFDLKWAADGKLYAKYREESSDPSDRDTYKYICDIDGDVAEIVIYYYSEEQFYHIAVNGEMVASYLYTANADAVNVEQIRIGLADGNIGDELQVDYFYTGSVKSTPFMPMGISVDTTTTADDGIVNVTYKFKGDGTIPGKNVYFAAFDKETNEIISVDVVSIADNAQYEVGGATISGSVTVDPQDYYGNVVKAFLWDENLAPLTDVKKANLSPLPPAFSNILASDNFDNGIVLRDGGFYVTEVWGTAKATEENNKFNLITDGSICGADVWISNANNYLKFTMSKSSKDAWARFESLVSFEITMLRDGSVIVEDLDAPNGYRIIVPACDNLSYDFAVKFDEATSTLSVWVDNVLVADDIRSNGFGYTLRLSSEMGNPGDTISISNFVAGRY